MSSFVMCSSASNESGKIVHDIIPFRIICCKNTQSKSHFCMDVNIKIIRSMFKMRLNVSSNPALTSSFMFDLLAGATNASYTAPNVVSALGHGMEPFHVCESSVPSMHPQQLSSWVFLPSQKTPLPLSLV